MLKFIFACLLLANGALYAYQQGFLETFIPSGREPSRASRQLNADKIRLMSSKETAATVAPPAPVVGSASASASATTSTEPANADTDKKPEQTVCTEVGNFTDVDARKFEKQLATLSLGDRLVRHKIEDNNTRIVAIPPQANNAAADKKAIELRRFGINDFIIVKDTGASQWSITLGKFKTEEEAQAKLADLNKNGVHSARISSYKPSNKKTYYQLRNLDANTKDVLEKIKTDFKQMEIRSCEQSE